MKKYFDYLYSLALSQTARSTYLTTFGSGINAFLGFVFTIVVARSISPADFGLFSVVVNLITVLVVIADVGFSSAVLKFLPQAIRDHQKEDLPKIIKVSFLFTLLVCGLLALLLFVSSSFLAHNIFFKMELSLPLAIASISLIGFALSYLFIAVLQGQQKFLFGVIAESSVLAVKVLATLALVLLGKLELNSLILIFSLTSFVGFMIGLFLTKLDFLKAKTDWRLVKVLFGFGIWVALARMINCLSARVDTLMLVRFVETSQVGFYAAAQRMTFIFPVLISGITVVLSPKFASLNSKTEVKAFIQKSILLISTLIIPILVLFFVAPWLTVWVYGEVYRPAASIFRWLLLSSSLFVATTVPMIIIIYYFGQSKFFTLISAFQLALIFLANLVLIPKMGVIGPAISLAFSYGMIFLISSLFVYQKFREQK
jgi:O-antigen/teichoic acid export membrane protein